MNSIYSKILNSLRRYAARDVGEAIGEAKNDSANEAQIDANSEVALREKRERELYEENLAKMKLQPSNPTKNIQKVPQVDLSKGTGTGDAEMQALVDSLMDKIDKFFDLADNWVVAKSELVKLATLLNRALEPVREQQEVMKAQNKAELAAANKKFHEDGASRNVDVECASKTAAKIVLKNREVADSGVKSLKMSGGQLELVKNDRTLVNLVGFGNGLLLIKNPAERERLLESKIKSGNITKEDAQKAREFFSANAHAMDILTKDIYSLMDKRASVLAADLEKYFTGITIIATNKSKEWKARANELLESAKLLRVSLRGGFKSAMGMAGEKDVAQLIEANESNIAAIYMVTAMFDDDFQSQASVAASSVRADLTIDGATAENGRISSETSALINDIYTSDALMGVAAALPEMSACVEDCNSVVADGVELIGKLENIMKSAPEAIGYMGQSSSGDNQELAGNEDADTESPGPGGWSSMFPGAVPGAPASAPVESMESVEASSASGAFRLTAEEQSIIQDLLKSKKPNPESARKPKSPKEEYVDIGTKKRDDITNIPGMLANVPTLEEHEESQKARVDEREAIEKAKGEAGSAAKIKTNKEFSGRPLSDAAKEKSEFGRNREVASRAYLIVLYRLMGGSQKGLDALLDTFSKNKQTLAAINKEFKQRYAEIKSRVGGDAGQLRRDERSSQEAMLGIVREMALVGEKLFALAPKQEQAEKVVIKTRDAIILLDANKSKIIPVINKQYAKENRSERFLSVLKKLAVYSNNSDLYMERVATAGKALQKLYGLLPGEIVKERRVNLKSLPQTGDIKNVDPDIAAKVEKEFSPAVEESADIVDKDKFNDSGLGIPPVKTGLVSGLDRSAGDGAGLEAHATISEAIQAVSEADGILDGIISIDNDADYIEFIDFVGAVASSDDVYGPEDVSMDEEAPEGGWNSMFPEEKAPAPKVAPKATKEVAVEAGLESSLNRKAGEFDRFDMSQNRMEIVEGEDGKKRLVINKNLHNLVTKRIVDMFKGAHEDGEQVQVDLGDHLGMGTIQAYMGSGRYKVSVAEAGIVEVPADLIFKIDNPWRI